MYCESLCKSVTKQAVLLRMKYATRLPRFLVPLKLTTGKTSKWEIIILSEGSSKLSVMRSLGSFSMLERDHC